MLTHSPIRQRNIGRLQLRWRTNIPFKRTEQTKHGLIYEDDDDDDDDDINITRSLKMVDNATIEFIKSTELASNSPGVYTPNYHIRNKLKQLVYKSQREPF
jgi:hypothetical protein